MRVVRRVSKKKKMYAKYGKGSGGRLEVMKAPGLYA